MTILVYRNGVMAADSGCWQGDGFTSWSVKIARGRGGVWGLCGSAAASESFLDWVRGEGDEMPMPKQVGDRDSSFAALCVMKASPGMISILCYDGFERFRDAPYLAMGAASPCALGALYCGASAVEAVRACIAHGPNAVGPARSVQLDDPEGRIEVHA